MTNTTASTTQGFGAGETNSIANFGMRNVKFRLKDSLRAKVTKPVFNNKQWTVNNEQKG